MNAVIAAIDLGPASARVLYHAAGFARLLSCDLKVLHVSKSPAESRAHVLEHCQRHCAYEINLEEDDVIVRSGIVSDTIVRESMREQARLIVVGSHGRGSVARLLLGSTSDAVLRGATSPVLIVPPTDLDIVNITDRASLTCGPILAAVDLGEACDRHLELAGELSRLSSQPLLLMTVARQRVSQEAATRKLRQRAHLLDDKPRALIVRRGDVAGEVSGCALSEGSGLVVMGVPARPRGTPGAIVSAVLRSSGAFVLAVPERSEERICA